MCVERCPQAQCLQIQDDTEAELFDTGQSVIHQGALVVLGLCCPEQVQSSLDQMQQRSPEAKLGPLHVSQ